MEVSFSAIFGRYVLEGLLGEGGAGQVFDAVLQGPAGFRKRVALKLLRADALDRIGASVDSFLAGSDRWRRPSRAATRRAKARLGA
ncbi:MAG: hypothetical protein GY898_30130 [Proteobacteria bacterium]|nr:hypothetical protein [Pseudomonadota bacterium]